MSKYVVVTSDEGQILTFDSAIEAVVQNNSTKIIEIFLKSGRSITVSFGKKEALEKYFNELKRCVRDRE